MAVLNLNLESTGAPYSTPTEHKTPVRQGEADSVFTSDGWRSNVVKADGQCFPDVKLLMLRYKLYYLPRDFTSIFVVAVYILPDENSKNALQELYEVSNGWMVFFIVAGYFNQTDLRSVFLNSTSIYTGGKNSLDHPSSST